VLYPIAFDTIGLEKFRAQISTQTSRDKLNLGHDIVVTITVLAHI
jgi:hypothetical protein